GGRWGCRRLRGGRGLSWCWRGGGLLSESRCRGNQDEHSSDRVTHTSHAVFSVGVVPPGPPNKKAPARLPSRGRHRPWLSILSGGGGSTSRNPTPSDPESRTAPASAPRDTDCRNSSALSDR